MDSYARDAQEAKAKETAGVKDGFQAMHVSSTQGSKGRERLTWVIFRASLFLSSLQAAAVFEPNTGTNTFEREQRPPVNNPYRGGGEAGRFGLPVGAAGGRP